MAKKPPGQETAEVGQAAMPASGGMRDEQSSGQPTCSQRGLSPQDWADSSHTKPQSSRTYKDPCCLFLSRMEAENPPDSSTFSQDGLLIFYVSRSSLIALGPTIFTLSKDSSTFSHGTCFPPCTVFIQRSWKDVTSSSQAITGRVKQFHY